MELTHCSRKELAISVAHLILKFHTVIVYCICILFCLSSLNSFPANDSLEDKTFLFFSINSVRKTQYIIVFDLKLYFYQFSPRLIC